MEIDKYTGEGYLSTPLNDLRKHIPPDSEGYRHFKQLEFNVNELNTLINTFKEQLREGCMLVQDGKILWTNNIATDLTGYSLQELTGKALVELTVPGMREKLEARIKLLVAGDQGSFPEEWPLLKADRTAIYVNVFAYSVRFLNNLAVLLFFYDVTEQRKMAEERRIRSEMMDSINDGVFLIDLNGQIVFANAAFCEMSGYSKEQVTGVNIIEMTAPELRRRFEIRMKQFSSHKEARFTTTALNKDGQRVMVEVRGKVITLNGKQRVLGVARAVRADNEPDVESMRFDS